MLNPLRASLAGNQLQLTWQGESGQQLRAAFGISNGQPVVRELAVRKGQAAWSILARDLTPEFDIVARRRVSEQQLAPLRALHIALTPHVMDREKWNAFWDAPLEVLGIPTPTPICRTSPRRSAAPALLIMPADVMPADAR
jgi:hypothetical protein